MVTTERTRSRCTFMHAFENSKRGKTVNGGTENKRHETFWKWVDKRFPCSVSLFKMKQSKKMTLGDKGLDFIVPEG